jgi:peptidoglycan L-alanyl-D-glutamate endopeptidase CwlK
MFTFAKSSLKYLEKTHPDLKKICMRVKELSEIDFDISCSYRSLSEQNKLYKIGRSKIDGINNKGKHNVDPSEAVDIYSYNGSKASYDSNNLSYMAGLFRAVSQSMYQLGEISHIIRWGGNWDQDGVLITDQGFDDLPHFEIVRGDYE